MRRVIGQFGDVAEEASKDNITHIITAAVSGCIIGEFVGLLMADRYQHQIPVDHMVFTRAGKEPESGLLRPGFKLSGKHVLLADDAIMETVTAGVMVKKLRSLQPNINISFMTIDIDPKVENHPLLKQFKRIYTFVE